MLVRLRAGGHANFEESSEEIAPLTEEERVAKLAELKERMLEKKKILVRSFRRTTPFVLVSS